MISRGTKVYALIRGQMLPAVVVFHHFASTGTYDLYMLRVAEYSQVMQRWQVSEYGPVQACKLVKRETYVPVLDLEPRSHLTNVPAWVRQLHRWRLPGHRYLTNPE